MEPWRIVERIQGYVDTREPGQDGWCPLFRSRRLSDGAFVKIHTLGAARLNMADGTSYFLSAMWHPIVFEISDYQLSLEGRKVVFDLRMAHVWRDMQRFFGVQFRFDPADNPGQGGNLGARG